MKAQQQELDLVHVTKTGNGCAFSNAHSEAVPVEDRGIKGTVIRRSSGEVVNVKDTGNPTKE